MGLCRVVLNPHRHHNVFEIGIVRNGKQRGAVGITKGQLHIVGMHIAQHVHQIADIEAHFTTDEI